MPRRWLRIAAVYRGELDLKLSLDILAHVNLPGAISGDTLISLVAQPLCRLDARQARRFIFLTGGASTPAAQVFLEGLANPCFEKPCDFKQLRAAIDRMGCETFRA